MALGFALAAVGMDTVTGTLRMTYGRDRTAARASTSSIAVIGLFGIGEILLSRWKKAWLSSGKSAKIQLGVVLQDLEGTAALLADLDPLCAWSAAGWASPPAAPRRPPSWRMAWPAAHAKDKDSFGKGNVEGVVAPETAAHAAGTSALLPMLTLGIPGSPTAAVLLGGLLIWGLQPGPLLFTEKPDFVWGLIASMYLGNIVGLIIVLTTCALVGRHPAHSVLGDRPGHHRDLRDRRLHGP
jgi:putative tricarboxylic transport membrane protein